MESERPIEKRLRDYGKRRREGTGEVSLHPATRRLLQGEVTRTYGAPAKPASLWHRNTWLRVAWSGAALGALIVLILTFSPEKHSPQEVASSHAPVAADALVAETTQEVNLTPSNAAGNYFFALADRPAGSPMAGAEPTAGALTTSTPAPTFGSYSRAAKVASMPAPPAKELGALAADNLNTATAPATALADHTLQPTLKTKKTEDDEKFALARSANTPANSVNYQRTDANEGPTVQPWDYKPSPAAAVPVARRAAESRKVEVARDSFMANQSYVRTQSPQAGNVAIEDKTRLLANFRVQQNGDSFEVIDADGSVYKGHLEPAQEGATAFGLPAETKTANTLSVAPAQREQALLFRVAGTNRSLRQHVFFTGQLVPQDGGLIQSQFNNSLQNLGKSAELGMQYSQTLNAANTAFSNQLQVAPLLQNSHISGRVRVGQEPEVEIRAEPQSQ